MKKWCYREKMWGWLVEDPHGNNDKFFDRYKYTEVEVAEYVNKKNEEGGYA